jgi:hypothetical protein
VFSIANKIKISISSSIFLFTEKEQRQQNMVHYASKNGSFQQKYNLARKLLNFFF